MLSIRLNAIRTNLRMAGIPLAVLAHVAKMPSGTLVGVYRETVRIDGQKELRLFELSRTLLALHESLYPFDLPRQQDFVAMIVEQLESGAVTLEEIKTSITRMIGSSSRAETISL